MKQLSNLTVIIVCSWILMQFTVSACPELCLEYKSGNCIQCPQNTHPYQNLCYKNIIGCIAYINGDQCTQCNSTYSYLSNKTCVITVNESQLTKYITLNTSSAGDDQYGESAFRMISLASAQNDSFFTACDNYMKKGQYGYFISQSVQPIISVSTYDSNGVRQFKILYEQSGGGLMLCLIGINMSTNQINLRSFVAIITSNLVYQCVDYTTKGVCTRCQNGYYLENGLCYQNIPNCISYIKNICIECKGFSLLIENRCISDCKALRDTRSLKFYQNYVIGNTIQSVDRSYFSF